MSKRVLQPFPGCTIVHTAAGDIQFGSPSEIIKLLQKVQIEVPHIIVLPDDFFAFGINQSSVEFPLYYFLFLKKGFFKSEKFILIGTPAQIRRVKTILKLTLLGPTDRQMKTWGISNSAELRRELNFMALKKRDTGRIAQIDDIITSVPFHADGTVTMAGVTIAKTGNNRFTVREGSEKVMEIDITLREKQPPPIPIKVPERRVFGGVLAMRAINTLSGFDPHGYTTGFILWVNGVMISIDGVSWMEDHLLIHGISHEKLRTYILTHIHDDHSSIIDQIVSSKRVTIVTAKVVFQCFIHKLASILDWSPARVQKLVNFIEAVPGQTQRIFGAAFSFWHTLHSIPMIGFKVAVRDQSYIFTGDMTYGVKLDEAHRKKAITTAKYRQQKGIPYLSDVTKIFVDGGGGEIHPDPSDFKNLGKNVIFFHTGELKGNMANAATLARAGTTWLSIPSKQMFIDDFTTFSNSPLFKEATLEWQRILLNAAVTENYNEGDFAVKEGEKGGSFYLVLAGTYDVISGNKVIARLQEGDFFGEAAQIFNKFRNMSIKVITPGAALRFPGDLFFQYANESGVDKVLRKIRHTSPLILQLGLFRHMTPGMTNWISEIAGERRYAKGAVIIREGAAATHFHVIREGTVRVDKTFGRKRCPIAELGPGQFVGEMGILGPAKITSATVTAVTAVKTLCFDKEHLQEIISANPYLHLTIGKVMDQRFHSNRRTGLALTRHRR
ncbi:MAG: cyclic nucleotide-binding domain-containing protein [Planctomycetota bacterium]